MARIAGVDLPKNKRMEIALTYIYGIGRTSGCRCEPRHEDGSARGFGNHRHKERHRPGTQGRRGFAPGNLYVHQKIDGCGELPRIATS